MVLQCPRYYFIFLCSFCPHHWSVSQHLPWLYADLIAEDKYLVFKSNKQIFLLPHIYFQIYYFYFLYISTYSTRKKKLAYSIENLSENLAAITSNSHNNWEENVFCYYIESFNAWAIYALISLNGNLDFSIQIMYVSLEEHVSHL